MPPGANPKDPWRRAPVGELDEPVLPRWFAVLAVVMVPAAAVALIAALALGGGGEVPLADRRPPPADGLTTGVGAMAAGAAPAAPYEQACPLFEGIQVAGSEADRAVLRQALAGLCNLDLAQDARRRLRAFAAAGGVVRFAVFELTGVDSAADLSSELPVIYLNARFSRTEPLWVGPVVVHDVTFLEHDPHTAEGALAARQAELAVCRALPAGRGESRACQDADALLALADPAAALREAGFR